MVLNFMKPFHLSLHSLLKPNIIQCTAHDPKALSLLIISHTPQLMLSPLIHYSQLMHETGPLIEQEGKGRRLVPAPAILLNQVFFIGVEGGLNLKQKFFVNYLETFKFYFSFHYWDWLHFSCEMFDIYVFEVFFKACIIKIEVKVQRISAFTIKIF
jgi:hypothetical protein